MFAYFLHHYDPFIVEFTNGVGLRWYGLAYVLGFLLGYWMYRSLSKRRLNEVHPDQVADFITWAAIFGVMLGGRLGWILFYGWKDVVENPLNALKVWEGGMSSHGGILGLVLFTLYYARRHRISWTSIGDSLVVAAPIGIFLVRCANFINGELWGNPTDVKWAVIFPHSPTPLLPRHPSQLYEAALEGVVLLTYMQWRFWRTDVVKTSPGRLTGEFLILYAILRAIGEMFREPDAGLILGLSRGTFYSVFLIAAGCVLIAISLRKRSVQS